MSRMLFQTAFKSICLCLCSHAAGIEETPHGLDNRGVLRSPDTLIGKENHISAISDDLILSSDRLQCMMVHGCSVKLLYAIPRCAMG